MKLGEIKIEGCSLTVSINLIVLFVLLAIIIACCIVKSLLKKNGKSFPFAVKKYIFTIGGVSTEIECDYSDREIAYQSWVEMNTRKVGLPFDETYDVIVEVYNSWYEFFGRTRETIKNLPGNKLNSSNDLIDNLTKVLNETMRTHLTKWQAKFRKWYSEALKKEDNKDLSPQEIQRKYPEYNELMDDLKKSVNQLIVLKDELYKIAFNQPKQ